MRQEAPRTGRIRGMWRLKAVKSPMSARESLAHERAPAREALPEVHALPSRANGTDSFPISELDGNEYDSAASRRAWQSRQRRPVGPPVGLWRCPELSWRP
jgi:hypothetical protein